MSRFRLICILLLWLLPSSLFAQTTRIRGQVKDAITGDAIPYALVYFDDTFIAVSTDTLGCYEITAKTLSVHSLTVETTGYASRTEEIVPGEDAVVNFILFPNLSSEEGASHRNRYVQSILYALDKNRGRHNPEAYPAWESRVYGKTELAITRANHFLGKALFKKRNGLIPEMQDSVFTGHVPVLMSESVIRRYHSLDPAVDKEVFEASRISGLDQQNVLRQFTGTSSLRMNFYRDVIPVFNLSIPSPASSIGHLFYHYDLTDSLMVDGRKTYSILFHPRRLITSPAWEGRMEVDAGDFALRAVHVRLSPTSNVNWISLLSVESENARGEDGVWFFQQERLYLDASAQLNDQLNVVSVQGIRQLCYTDVSFGPFEGMEKLVGGDKIAVDKDPEKDAAYWEQARPAPLTPHENSIFTVAERFKETRSFKWFSALGNMFVTGFLENKDWGIGYGPWERTLSFSKTEGTRIQAGFRTTKEFSSKVRLRAMAAYGFGDRQFKWDATSEFMLGDNQVRTNKLTLYAAKNYESLGNGSGVYSERNIINSLLAPGGFDKSSMMFRAQVEHRYEFSPNFNSTLILQHLRIYGNADVPLIRPDGTLAESCSANQIHWIGRFSWEERINRGVFEKSYIFTRYPIVTVDLLAGIKGLTSDDCSFYRGELTVDWRIPAGLLGFGNFHMNGGAILGSVPYPLLKLHEGNQSRLFRSPVVSLLDKSAFSLMNYYEFASDRWVTAFYEHNFNGLVLGNIPLVKRLSLREVVTLRGAWGTLSEQNRSQAPFLLMDGMSSLETPYIEAGVGIANIFRLLRVDCFWKLTHRTDRNFVVNIGLDLDF